MKPNKRLFASRHKNAFLCAIVAILTLLAFTSNNHMRSKVTPPTTAVEIKLSETGESFLRRLPSSVTAEHHPAGLNFYSLGWPVAAMGSVFLKQNPGQLRIENVISVTGTEDIESLSEGMYRITINSAITKSEKISHDEARIKTYEYLQTISRQGWRATIPRTMARLRGKEMMGYTIQARDYTTLDPAYVPTLHEWMQLPTLTEWQFYSNYGYLTVQMTRMRVMTDPNKLGVYLLSTILESEAEYYRGDVEPKDRPRWKEKLMPQISQMSAIRTNMEAELRKRGFAIDEKYIDPPLPSLE